MDVKVFLSVLAALLVALAVGVVAYELHEQWQEYKLRSALNDLSDQINQVAQQSLQDSANEQRRQSFLDYQRRQRAQQTRFALWQSLQLAPDQQCIGGVVITVHGTVYTQEIQNYRPVACEGRQRILGGR